MALSAVLVAVAGIGTHVGLQDPTFDLQFAVPVLDKKQEPAPVLQGLPYSQGVSQKQGQAANPNPAFQGIVSGLKESESWKYVVEPAQIATTVHFSDLVPTQTQVKRVSAQFKNARASEVLSWLEKQGVSFIVGDGMIPPATTVTLNIVDQPVNDVVDALATALGGHWSRQNNVRVFVNGPAPFPTPLMRSGSAVPPPGFNEKEFQVRMEAMAKDMEKRYNSPEFHAQMKKMSEQMAKDIQVYIERDGKLYKETLKPGSDPMVFRFQDGKLQKELLEKVKVDSKAMTIEAQKIRAEALKSAEKSRVEALRAAEASRAQNAKIRVEALKSAEIARAQSAKVRSEALKARDQSITVYRSATAPRVGTVRTATPARSTVDAKRFLDSLTPDQKHSMRMRGYILYIDLTREQRQMLGEVPKGKFEMKMKVNDQEVVVRGS